jgi:serine/threonine protein kinase/tetratricopeptide (TPR) repeat protein
MIGRTISHFKILKKLGEGGMGVVYEAEDTRLKRTVALKFLPPGLANDPAAKARFIHEAQAASALDHPNVCTVYEIGEVDKGQMFIAMACYEGESLQERIARGPLSFSEAVDIAEQIAKGLAKAHEKEIVHRDIKPANIFLTTDGLAKILDFGLAKLAGQTRMTRTGTTVGTVAYMSPEQCGSNDIDHRTDIWSLGATLHEMITGTVPFRGDQGPAMVYSIMNEEPASTSKLCPGVPQKIEEIIVRALEKRPEDRFADASIIVDELNELRQLLKTKSELRGRRVLSRRARRKRRLITAGVVAVAAFATLLSIHTMTTKNAAGSPAITVIPLANNSDDDESKQMTLMVARMLTTDLGESNHIRVLGSAGLKQILLNRKLKNSTEFTIEDFRGIARSANLSHIVTLSLFRGGANLRTDIEILDMSSGDVIVTASEESAGMDNLIQMIDPLATKTREALLSGSQLASEHDRPFGDITSHSGEAVALYYQALEYEEQGNAARAIALYDDALELDSTFFLAGLSRDFHLEGNLAFFDIEDIEQLSDYERLQFEAQGALSAGDFPALLEKANQMLALRPGNRIGIQMKYEAQYFMGLYEEAVETCEEAIHKGYRTYYEHLFLNSSYAMSGLDAAEMRDGYLRLLEKDSSDSMMKFWLAVTCLILNKDTEAEDLLDLVFEVYPGNETFLKVLSDTYVWRESPDKDADYQCGLAYLEQMRELRMAYDSADTLPDDPGEYEWLLYGVPFSFKLGELYMLKGQLDEAIAAYERSLDLKADHYNSFYRLGLAYEQKGQADKAIANYKKYIDVDELNAYDASALGREDGCAAWAVCHPISRPAAVADAKQRIEQLR